MGILVVGFLIFAACGGDGATDTTGGPQSTAEGPTSPEPESTTLAPSGEVDPCGFLSDSEMSEVLGFDVTSSFIDPDCEYSSPETTEAVSLNVENVAGDGCEGVFNVAGYGSTGGEPVDGIGTYAKYAGSFPPQLAVCFDNQWTLIASDLTDSADHLATLVAVAQAFEANIP